MFVPEKLKRKPNLISGLIIAASLLCVWYLPPIIYDHTFIKEYLIHAYYYLSITIAFLVIGFLINDLVISETLLVAGMAVALRSCWWWNSQLTSTIGFPVFLIIGFFFFLAYNYSRKNIALENVLYNFLETLLSVELTLYLSYVLLVYGLTGIGNWEKYISFIPFARYGLMAYPFVVEIGLYVSAWFLSNNMLAWACFNAASLNIIAFLLFALFGPRGTPGGGKEDIVIKSLLMIACILIGIGYYFFGQRRKKLLSR